MLKDQIQNELKNAMKSGDSLRRTLFQTLLAAVRNKEIEKRAKIKDTAGKSDEELRALSQLNDDEVIGVISSEVKKRKDSVLMFEKGGRTDLAEKEKSEIEILFNYLPRQLSEEEIEKEAREIIKEKKGEDFGKVMKEASTRLKGKAEGGLISRIVKKLLEEK